MQIRHTEGSVSWNYHAYDIALGKFGYSVSHIHWSYKVIYIKGSILHPCMLAEYAGRCR